MKEANEKRKIGQRFQSLSSLTPTPSQAWQKCHRRGKVASFPRSEEPAKKKINK